MSTFNMKLQRITWYTLGSYCVTHERNHYSSFFCHSSSVLKTRMNLSAKQEKTRKVTTSSHLFRPDTKRDEEMIEEADVREWIGNCSWVSIDYLRFLASSSPIRFVFLSFCFRSSFSSLSLSFWFCRCPLQVFCTSIITFASFRTNIHSQRIVREK